MIFTTRVGATRFSCDLNTCPQRPRNAAHVRLQPRGVQCPDRAIFKIRLVINGTVSPGNSGRTAGEKLVLSDITRQLMTFPKEKKIPLRADGGSCPLSGWAGAGRPGRPRRSPHGLPSTSSVSGSALLKHRLRQPGSP